MKIVKVDATSELELTNAQYQKLLTMYKKFYKLHSACTDACPVMSASDNPMYTVKDVLRKLVGKSVPMMYACRLCYTWPEFTPSNSKDIACPCHTFGAAAFNRLEKMLIREGRL